MAPLRKWRRLKTPCRVRPVSRGMPLSTDCWAGDGYGDVQIQGRALLIGMPGDQTLQNCRAVASLAQSYNGGFDSIVLESGPRATRRTVRCGVPALQTAAASGAFTIDASGGDLRSGDAAAIKAIRADLKAQDIGVEALSLTGQRSHRPITTMSAISRRMMRSAG